MICNKCGVDKEPEKFAPRKLRDGSVTKRRQCNDCREKANRDRISRLSPERKARFRKLRNARTQRFAEGHPFYWIAKQMRYRAMKDRVKVAGVDAAFLQSLWDRQEGRCALTGEPMSLAVEKRGWQFQRERVALARTDSAHGYVPDNVGLVQAGVGLSKNYHTNEQFIAICRAVAMHADAKLYGGTRAFIERAVAAGYLPAVFRWNRRAA